MFCDKDGDEWSIEMIAFVGICLKEPNIDHNYGWFLGNNESDLHFPQSKKISKVYLNILKKKFALFLYNIS